jgi:phosphatidylglycerophosphatase C
MSGVVAVFDLDGTITRGDTYLAFLIHTLRRRPHRAVRSAELLLAAGRFKLGRLSHDELKSIFLTAIAGGSGRDAMARHVDSFLPHCLRRMIKPEALARIEWHRSRGHRLVLASASVDLYVVRLGAHWQFDATISTRTAWHDGRLTGALDGPNLRGDAKLAAVRDLIGETRPEMFAYSDHHSDLPLLQFADHAVAVNPTPKLLADSKANGIKVEYW